MGEKTGIAWTDHTFNIAWGCVKVSPGCKNCYAETISKRFGGDIWGPGKPRRTFGDKHWAEPRKWNRRAELGRTRERVFTSSMCDVFEDHPDIDVARARLWGLIQETPWLDWQILTKRAERIAPNIPSPLPRNVWMGVSIERDDYTWRADYLRDIDASVRFISYEPALGPLDTLRLDGIDWLIYGGESGRGYRPDDPEWAQAIQRMCVRAGTRFFYKQSAGLGPGRLRMVVPTREWPMGRHVSDASA